MAMQNVFNILVDLKDVKTIPQPLVTQNDSVVFILEVMENGVPFDLTDTTTVSLAHTRKDKTVVVTTGTKVGNKATFALGTNETSVTGAVTAKAQFYDAEGRVSTLSFGYSVGADPTGSGYEPSASEATLIEVVLNDGPLIIASAEEAAAYANEQGDYALQVGVDNETRYLNAVETVALRDSTYPSPSHGDTVRVTTPIDGKAKSYRYVLGTGWVVTDVYNSTAIDQVNQQLAETSDDIKNINSFIASENERIAHRGFSGVYPENTMIAFGKAIEAGFESLEWDVQISSDGIPVVFHDSTVDRTTNGTGNLKDKTLADLRSLDAGTKYSAYYAGAKIPTLAEVLQISKGVSKYIYPEIKDYRTIADTTIITQAIIDSGLENKCVIQAANFACFPYVRALSNDIVIGYLIGSAGEFANALSQAKLDNNSAIIAEQYILINNPTYVTQARAEGVDIIAWTVDTSRAMKKLRDIGVVRVMQNHLRSVVR